VRHRQARLGRARDDAGRVWLISRGELHKARDPLCAAAFAPGESHPFTDGRLLHEALVDARGNTFLLAAQAPASSGFDDPAPPYEYAIIPARHPAPPDTAIAVTAIGDDSFRAQFSSAGEGERWFTWRLDGGAWTPPARETHARFDSLAAGEHTIEAAALDDDLQIDPAPATATFTATLDPGRQVRAWIARLNDPDFAQRETAVAALVSRGAAVLPELKAARPAASDDARWWIEAAIQQIDARAH